MDDNFNPHSRQKMMWPFIYVIEELFIKLKSIAYLEKHKLHNSK